MRVFLLALLFAALCGVALGERDPFLAGMLQPALTRRQPPPILARRVRWQLGKSAPPPAPPVASPVHGTRSELTDYVYRREDYEIFEIGKACRRGSSGAATLACSPPLLSVVQSLLSRRLRVCLFTPRLRRLLLTSWLSLQARAPTFTSILTPSPARPSARSERRTVGSRWRCSGSLGALADGRWRF